MHPIEYYQELIKLALPYVEAWTDGSISKRAGTSKPPAALGDEASHKRLVKMMRDEALSH